MLRYYLPFSDLTIPADAYTFDHEIYGRRSQFGVVLVVEFA